MLLWTGETDGVGQLSGGYARTLATASPTFGKPSSWTGVESPKPVRQEHEGRAPWRPRALKGAVLLMLVACELAWLIVPGLATHRLFLQSLLEY